MTYPSSTDATFLATAKAWLEAFGEILVLIRYDASAGNKDFELHTSFSSLQNRIATLSSRACITLFRNKQLPIRGTIDSQFTAMLLAAVPDGEEWLVVQLEKTNAGKAEWYHHAAGESHVELREELENHIGRLAAAGRYPPWLEDNESVISAVVPQDDGSVVVGAY